MIASIVDLVAFLKRFHRRWLDDPTINPSLIPADLPPPLATIYRELGALAEVEQSPTNDGRTPFSAQDSLVPLSRLKRVDGMVEFAWENQGNWSARCPVGEADPPVYSDAADCWNTVQRGFVVVCDSLAHFLTTLCLQEAVMGSRYLAALRAQQPPEQALAVRLNPLWLNGQYVEYDADRHFFVSADEEVLVMAWAGLWVGSPTRKAADLVTEGVKVQVIH